MNVFKVCVIGGYVGKTCLANRYVYGMFSPNRNDCEMVEDFVKVIKLDDEYIQVSYYLCISSSVS